MLLCWDESIERQAVIMAVSATEMIQLQLRWRQEGKCDVVNYFTCSSQGDLVGAQFTSCAGCPRKIPSESNAGFLVFSTCYSQHSAHHHSKFETYSDLLSYKFSAPIRQVRTQRISSRQVSSFEQEP